MLISFVNFHNSHHLRVSISFHHISHSPPASKGLCRFLFTLAHMTAHLTYAGTALTCNPHFLHIPTRSIAASPSFLPPSPLSYSSAPFCLVAFSCIQRLASTRAHLEFSYPQSFTRTYLALALSARHLVPRFTQLTDVIACRYT